MFGPLNPNSIMGAHRRPGAPPSALNNPPRHRITILGSLFRTASWIMIVVIHQWRYVLALSLSLFLAHHAWNLTDTVFHYPANQVPWLYPAFVISLVVLQLRFFLRLIDFLIPTLVRPQTQNKESHKPHENPTRTNPKT